MRKTDHLAIAKNSKSEAFRKLNPHIFALAGLRPAQPKPDQRSKSQDQRMEARQERIRYRVTFTVYRKRLLDQGDNDRYAMKPLRDRVAEYLGLANDNNEFLQWHYFQIKSRGPLGTHVLIETL